MIGDRNITAVVNARFHYNINAVRLFVAAFDTVVETLSSPSFEQAVGARGSDVAFLSELLNNTVVQSLIRVGTAQ